MKDIEGFLMELNLLTERTGIALSSCSCCSFIHLEDEIDGRDLAMGMEYSRHIRGYVVENWEKGLAYRSSHGPLSYREAFDGYEEDDIKGTSND